MIHLYTADPRIRKLMKEATAGVTKLKVHAPPRKELPREFEFVVTTGQLNSGIERFAAQYGALVVVLPEAGFWLANEARNDDATALGSDYRDVRV